MLGLAEQIGGDPVRIILAIGNHHDFRRTGHHVDADHPEHLPFRLRDPGIAGTGDDIDGFDLFRTISERCDRLGATNAPDFVDPGQLRRRQHQRIDGAAIGRRDHDDPLDTGSLGRNRVHQHRRRIGRTTTGNIDARALDGVPAGPDPDSSLVHIVPVFRELPFMVITNS